MLFDTGRGSPIDPGIGIRWSPPVKVHVLYSQAGGNAEEKASSVARFPLRSWSVVRCCFFRSTTIIDIALLDLFARYRPSNAGISE